WPPGATRLADSRTSSPAPDPRSRTTWPGSSAASIVGLPQPRLTDSDSPIAFSSSAEYEPEQPQSGPSAWQQPALDSGSCTGMTESCLATLAYLDRTASRISLMSGRLQLMNVDGWILTQSIESCRWLA